MIKNKFLLVLSLCVGLSSHVCFSAQEGYFSSLRNRAFGTGSYLWNAGTQRLSEARDYAASFVPQAWSDAVSTWSIQKKLTIAAIIIGSLVALGWNKDTIMQWASDVTSSAVRKLPTAETAKNIALVGGTIAGAGLVVGRKKIVSERKERERLRGKKRMWEKKAYGRAYRYN